jgi:hypothetical protein
MRTDKKKVYDKVKPKKDYYHTIDPRFIIYFGLIFITIYVIAFALATSQISIKNTQPRRLDKPNHICRSGVWLRN